MEWNNSCTVDLALLCPRATIYKHAGNGVDHIVFPREYRVLCVAMTFITLDA
jgi:hypothetical protein